MSQEILEYCGFRRFSTPGNDPAIGTGGAFGPEAGLIVLPALAVGVGLIYLPSRLRAFEKPDI